MDWYKSVEETHDALKERTELIVVGGLSAGVLLVLHLAARRPWDVDGTLLFSPTFWPDEFRWLGKTVEKELSEIKQPALIFHPRFDDQSDMRNSILLQRKLAGLVEVVFLDNSYHMVTLDQQREDVADRSVTFCASLLRQHEQQQQMMGLKSSGQNA